jgi:hypothetical protein
MCRPRPKSGRRRFFTGVAVLLRTHFSPAPRSGPVRSVKGRTGRQRLIVDPLWSDVTTGGLMTPPGQRKATGVTNQKPDDTFAQVDEAPGNLLLGLVVIVLAFTVVALGGLAAIDPASLVSLAPDWFAEPGTASVVAGTGLLASMATLIYQAVRAGNRGDEQFATWLTLGALMIVPMFSIV